MYQYSSNFSQENKDSSLLIFIYPLENFNMNNSLKKQMKAK